MDWINFTSWMKNLSEVQTIRTLSNHIWLNDLKLNYINYSNMCLMGSRWIYIVRPDIDNLKLICKQINNDIRLSHVSRYPYKIIFAPRKIFTCDLIFEQEGIFEYVVLDELENDLIQLDSDILSMELPKFFTNYFLVSV